MMHKVTKTMVSKDQDEVFHVILQVVDKVTKCFTAAIQTTQSKPLYFIIDHISVSDVSVILSSTAERMTH